MLSALIAETCVADVRLWGRRSLPLTTSAGLRCSPNDIGGTLMLSAPGATVPGPRFWRTGSRDPGVLRIAGICRNPGSGERAGTRDPGVLRITGALTDPGSRRYGPRTP